MSDFITQIYEDNEELLLIHGKGGAKVPYTNALLFNDVLIDTGISPTYLNKIRRGYPISRVIFSHWHDDHIRDHKIFKNVIKSCHVEAKPIIEDIDKLIDLYNIRKGPAEQMFKRFLSDYIDVYDSKIESVFHDGEMINDSSEVPLEVVYTPGHSIGHCSFHLPEKDFAFIADIDLSKFGPWYGGLDSNIEVFIHSIEKIIDLNLDVVATGHGKGIYYGRKNIREKLLEYKSIFSNRDKKILEKLSERKPTLLQDLIEKKIIYQNYEFIKLKAFKIFVLTMEKTMIRKHLNRLIEENIVEQNENGYILK